MLSKILTKSLKQLDREQVKQFTQALLLYIFNAFRFEEKEFDSYTKNLPPMVQTLSGSLYERLINKGEKRGMEKGKAFEFLKNNVINVLKNLIRFPEIPMQEVADFEEVTIEFVKAIKKGFFKGEESKARKTLMKIFKEKFTLMESDINEIEQIVTRFCPKFQHN